MKKRQSIAIYSGVSQSTTFIERLIKGLVKANTNVYVFGSHIEKPTHHKNITYITYGQKWHKLVVLIKYSILLFIFKLKEKKRLDAIIEASGKGSYLLRLKYYPVLYHRPDIFHIQWAKSLEDWIWVEGFGMKVVLSLRGAHINYSPIIDKQLATLYKLHFPKISAFHAVSKAIAKEATKYGADADKIKVIKSGLNFDDFSFELKLYNSETPLEIISVGRDHWKKNYKLALDALFELKQLEKAFHYTIIGVKNNEALLHQRSQLRLEENVSFIDSLAFSEVQEAIKKADVMLLPSVEEGIANVVLEAMALGTLVVSTTCGGMAEVVFPNETGFLVPNRNVVTMYKTLIEVSELSIEDYQRITTQAKAFVENYHNENQMVTEMQSFYKTLKPQIL
ncbi:glycosyltransferase family 4 protein [Winogradskyella bathintestinalis]|uniref:Glycosyltransferase family 4 protein n=1 Tax=Winogradskyella bathintestinalis TaxID=3035208 RepID=A0ABT7ZTU3_9FLAO|nr:glycosyltransferase family 4 protein [Winogradskyella bathintestinalis]MDN3492415.1 glycosyltransferase family 4 protein [Winogradskyella bathintestinalis]